MPIFFAFITSTAPEGVAVMTDINRYLDFVDDDLFAFGVAFEVPVATVILVLIGIVTPRNHGRQTALVIVGAFIVGMLLTPPDVISRDPAGGARNGCCSRSASSSHACCCGANEARAAAELSGQR